MQKKVKKKKSESELVELQHLAKRIQADFDNYRNRVQKEKEEFSQFATNDLVIRLLPTLDHFKLALKHLPKELAENDWVKGIWHIERQLEQTLADEGLSEIETVDQKFDHELHEAVGEVKSAKPPGTIVEEVQKGYKLGNRILRPAKVKIAEG